MKKLIRMLVFSAVALYLTSLWNKGFNLHLEPSTFIKAAFLIGLVYYLIKPILKIVFIPLNFITFGLASLFFYGALLYFIFNRFSLAEIRDWQFPGLNLAWIHIPKLQLNYWQNVLVVSLSLSAIINLLESFL